MTGQKNRFKTTEKLWNLDDKQLKTPKHDAMVLWLMDENNLKSVLMPLLPSYRNESGFAKSLIEPNEIIEDKIKINSETPLFSSPTFIAGYADFTIYWYHSVAIKNYPCPIESFWIDKIKAVEYISDMEKILQEYFNDKEYEFKKCLKKDYYYYMYGKDSTKENIYWRSYSYSADVEDLKLLDFVLNVIEEYPCRSDELEEWIRGETFYHDYKYTDINCLIEVKPYIDSFGAVLRQIKSYSKFWNGHGIICLFTLDDRFDAQFESQGIKVLHPPDGIDIDDMLDMYGLR